MKLKKETCDVLYLGYYAELHLLIHTKVGTLQIQLMSVLKTKARNHSKTFY